MKRSFIGWLNAGVAKCKCVGLTSGIPSALGRMLISVIGEHFGSDRSRTAGTSFCFVFSRNIKSQGTEWTKR